MATKQYVLGRGKVYFDAMLPNSKTRTGERFMGNVTAFNMSIESESLDHYDSTQGIREKDKTVTLQINRAGTLTTDDMNTENILLFILGESETVTQTATPVVDEEINGVLADRWYQLGASGSNPTGVRGVGSVTVTNDTGVTTYVADTDYTLDADLGRIYIIDGGAISDGDDLLVDYTPVANSRTRIASSASATLDGSLRFVATNPEGPKHDVYLPYCRLSPSGELPMIGDEWQAMSFNLDIQKYDDNTAAIFIDGEAA